MRYPARQSRTSDGVEHDRRRVLETGIGLFAAYLDEYEHDIWRRPLYVRLGGTLCVLLQRGRVADDDERAIGEHGRRAENRSERFGGDFRAAADFEIEISRCRVDRRIDEERERLLLSEVVVTDEQVRRVERS